MEGNHQLFRQYDRFNGDTFLDYLKKLHAKFSRCYLFMDKASSPHHKSKKVRKYFEENKDTISPIYLPTASPESLWLWKRYGIWPNEICLS